MRIVRAKLSNYRGTDHREIQFGPRVTVIEGLCLLKTDLRQERSRAAAIRLTCARRDRLWVLPRAEDPFEE
jgi:hypothetical protein